jgi:hypothetical protein
MIIKKIITILSRAAGLNSTVSAYIYSIKITAMALGQKDLTCHRGKTYKYIYLMFEEHQFL